MSLQDVIALISAQQGKDRTPVWMVGEQLKDMLRDEPHLAEIVGQDLVLPEMAVSKCEAKIKEYADKHKTGSFSCVVPSEAERIIREFYGLPPRGAQPQPAGEDALRLEDFF